MWAPVTAGSTGDATIQLNSLTVASTAGAGIVVDGSAGSGTTTVTGFSGNSVTKAATGGALFNTVTFDSSLVTPGIQPVAAGTLTVGAVPGDVTGAGVSIQDSMGNLNLGVAKIFNNNRVLTDSRRDPDREHPGRTKLSDSKIRCSHNRKPVRQHRGHQHQLARKQHWHRSADLHSTADDRVSVMSILHAMRIDNGERLGVSPPWPAHEHTEG